MAQNESQFRPLHLTEKQRTVIFDKTVAKVTKHYFDPKFNGVDWPALALEKRESIIALSDPEEFELAVHDLVRSLRTSHTGFFHRSVRRVPGRLAIGASFRRVESPSGPRWMVLDVHEGGPAHTAGLAPLDVVVSINGKPIVPPEQPMFPMGATAAMTLEKDGSTRDVSIGIPAPRSRKQPYSEPQAVKAEILPDSIGYLKVSIFPGLLGIDVSRELDAAVKTLSDCSRLILDLRGHLGGGLGVLRLMSYLTPGKIPIGYTVTRRRAEKGYEKERLRRLDRLPSTKLFGIPGMALKYIGRDPSVVLVSEGLGRQPWHGRIVILTNEHTVSAGEMVCAFARENGLARIVGTETAGRLMAGSGFKVGHGYMVIMPKAAFITWQGNMYEGRGIAPDVIVPWAPDAYREGRDNQLEAASRILCESSPRNCGSSQAAGGTMYAG
jgi:C-terminal processing protease CtpA/Prc